MSNVLEKYYQLVLKDKEYLEKYVLNKNREAAMHNFVKRQMEECFIWRKVASYEVLENIVHSKEKQELLRINDYYSDEMCELLEQHLQIDFQKLSIDELSNILSEDNLQRILDDKNVPKRLKDCIILEQESQVICKEMYEYMTQNKKIKKQEELDFEESEE